MAGLAGVAHRTNGWFDGVFSFGKLRPRRGGQDGQGHECKGAVQVLHGELRFGQWKWSHKSMRLINFVQRTAMLKSGLGRA